MNSHKIDKLLDKYFEGETNLQEEDQLREYFSGGGFPSKYNSVAAYFSFLMTEHKKQIDNPDFDQKIMTLVKENKLAKIIDIRSSWFYWASGIAVSIMILIAVMVKFDPFTPRIEDTFQDPQTAYHEARKILLFVADKFNHGTSRLEPVTRFETGINSIKPISAFNKGLNEISILDQLDKANEQIMTQ